MFDPPGNHCCDMQRWMVGNLEETGLTFKALGDDVENNRHWMGHAGLEAVFNEWRTCFPNWK
jgi:hypothetical protein